MRTSLPFDFRDLAPLTLGISELLAYALDTLAKVRDRIGDSGNNCMPNKPNNEKEE